MEFRFKYLIDMRLHQYREIIVIRDTDIKAGNSDRNICFVLAANLILPKGSSAKSAGFPEWARSKGSIDDPL